MMDFIWTFWQFILSPSKCCRYYRGAILWGIPPHWRGEHPPELLSLTEVIGLAFLFVMLEKILELFVVTKGVIFLDLFLHSSFFSKIGSFFVLLGILKVIFFPLWAYFWSVILKCLIRMALAFIDSPYDQKDLHLIVVQAYFFSYWILPLPFIGGVMRRCFSFYYVWVGLREALLLSRSQTLFVMVCPFLFMLLSLISMGLPFLLF